MLCSHPEESDGSLKTNEIKQSAIYIRVLTKEKPILPKQKGLSALLFTYRPAFTVLGRDGQPYFDLIQASMFL